MQSESRHNKCTKNSDEFFNRFIAPPKQGRISKSDQKCGKIKFSRDFRGRNNRRNLPFAIKENLNYGECGCGYDVHQDDKRAFNEIFFMSARFILSDAQDDPIHPCSNSGTPNNHGRKRHDNDRVIYDLRPTEETQSSDFSNGIQSPHLINSPKK